MKIFNRYHHNLLGVISDMGYPKGGIMDPSAGLQLAHKIREINPYLPFLIQSNERGRENIMIGYRR